MSSSTPPTARNKAIQYLALREHSYLELARKLKKKGYENPEVDAALAKLMDDNLLSDMRFGEAFVRASAQKGQGAVRIRMALKEKGLNDFQIENAFKANSHIDWDELIERVFLKKFPISIIDDDIDRSINSPTKQQSAKTASEKAKRWRFLQYRGFSQSQIGELFRRIASLTTFP